MNYVIFLVDDDRFVRSYLQAGLSTRKIDVLSFAGFSECLAKEKPVPDLYIFDFFGQHNDTMNNALDAFLLLRKQKNKSPVIIISGDDDRKFGEKLLRLGIYAFEIKNKSLPDALKGHINTLWGTQYN
jgi:DNA-binding NarL/FixJ family response regulator